MNLLLDSCALLALAQGSLSSDASRTLETADDACVSVVSPWELAIKIAKGSLSLNEPVYSWFTGLAEHYRLRVLALDPFTACAAAALPPIHRDPFDRVLIAIAHHRQLTILTSDQTIPTYRGVQTLW